MADRWLGPSMTTRRLVSSVALLLMAYAAFLALGDTRAYSGSDAGGKAATARAMADSSSWEPDIGYWAAAIDPDGSNHPIVNTGPRGEQWVQATSVPFSMASAWLWSWGGATAALAIALLGGALAAVSARNLASRLGSRPGVAEAAFWVTGLLGPVGFYALDLWEHALAAGLVLAAVAEMVRPGRAGAAAWGGIAAGLAIVLRAETALVLVGIAFAVILTGSLRRAWLSRWWCAVLAAAGAAAMFVANQVLEQRYLGADLRSGRASTLVGGAGSELVGRLRDAVIETASPFADDGALGVAAGVLLAASLLALAAIGLGRWKPSDQVTRVIGAIAGAIYLGRLLQGLGFVPGMLAVSPLAAVGLVSVVRRGSDPRRRAVALGAAGALPLIWMLQWQGNHSAQWGGRYVLTSGALIAVVGLVDLSEAEGPTWFPKAVGIATLVLGLFGLTWHAQRTAAVGRAFDELAAIPGDAVVVSLDPNLLREGGAWYVDGRWLNAGQPGAVLDPGGFADELGIDRVALLVPSGFGAIDLDDRGGFRLTDTGEIDVVGGSYQVLLLDRTDP